MALQFEEIQILIPGSARQTVFGSVLPSYNFREPAVQEHFIHIHPGHEMVGGDLTRQPTPPRALPARSGVIIS